MNNFKKIKRKLDLLISLILLISMVFNPISMVFNPVSYVYANARLYDDHKEQAFAGDSDDRVREAYEAISIDKNLDYVNNKIHWNITLNKNHVDMHGFIWLGLPDYIDINGIDVISTDRDGVKKFQTFIAKEYISRVFQYKPNEYELLAGSKRMKRGTRFASDYDSYIRPLVENIRDLDISVGSDINWWIDSNRIKHMLVLGTGNLNDIPSLLAGTSTYKESKNSNNDKFTFSFTTTHKNNLDDFKEGIDYVPAFAGFRNEGPGYNLGWKKNPRFVFFGPFGAKGRHYLQMPSPIYVRDKNNLSQEELRHVKDDLIKKTDEYYTNHAMNGEKLELNSIKHNDDRIILHKNGKIEIKWDDGTYSVRGDVHKYILEDKKAPQINIIEETRVINQNINYADDITPIDISVSDYPDNQIDYSLGKLFTIEEGKLPDGLKLTYQPSGNGSITGKFENLDFSRSLTQTARFTIKAEDKWGNVSRKVINFTVTKTDHTPPKLTVNPLEQTKTNGENIDKISINIEEQYPGKIDGKDFKVEGLPPGLNVDYSKKEITGTITGADFSRDRSEKTYRFKIITKDKSENKAEKDIIIKLRPQDQDPPEIDVNLPSQTVDYQNKQGRIQDIIVTVRDENLKQLSGRDFEIVGSLPQGLRIEGNKIVGSLTNVAFANDEIQKEFNFKVRAEDIFGKSSQKDIKIIVKIKDEANPVINVDPENQIVEYSNNSGVIRDINIDIRDENLKQINGRDFEIVGHLPSGLRLDSSGKKIVGRLTNVTFNANETQKNFTFKIKAQDKLGHVAEKTVTLTVKIKDDTPPQINVDPETQIVEYSNNSGTLQDIQVDVIEENPKLVAGNKFEIIEKPSELNLRIEGGKIKGSVSNINFNGATQKTLTFKIKAEDKLGHISQKSVNLVVKIKDDKAPVIKVEPQEQVIEYENNRAILQNIRVTVTDENLKLFNNNKFKIEGINGLQISNDIISGTLTNVEFGQNQTEKDLTFNVVAEDIFGHTTRQEVRLKLKLKDNQKPVVNVENFEQEITEGDNIQEIKINIEEQYPAKIDGNPFKVENLPSGLNVDYENKKITGTINGLQFTSTKKKEVVEFEVWAKDTSNNISDRKKISITVNAKDQTPPVLNVNQNINIDYQNNQGQIGPIDVEVIDDNLKKFGNDNFKLVEVPSVTGLNLRIENNKIVGEVSNLDFGQDLQKNIKFKIRAEDTLGYVSEKEVNLNIQVKDNTKPIINITPQEQNIDYENNQGTLTPITVNVLDDNLQINENGNKFTLEEVPNGLDLRIQDGVITGSVSNIDFDNDAREKEISFKIKAIDKFGNFKEEIVKLKLIQKDTNPPTLNITNENQEFVYGKAIKPITVTAEDENLLLDNGNRFSIDPNLPEGLKIEGNQIVGEPSGITFAPDEDEKIIKFKIKAKDKFGNQVEKEVILKLKKDKNAPSITVDPENPIINDKQRLEINVTVTDPENLLDDTQPPFTSDDLPDGLRIEGNKIVGTLTNVEFNGNTQKDISFTIKARDKQGNESSKQITIKVNAVDNKAPIIIATPIEQEVIANSPIEDIEVKVEDKEGFLADMDDSGAKFKLENLPEGLQLVGDTIKGIISNINFNGIIEKVFHFTIKAKDKLGNLASETVTINLKPDDENPPSIIVSPENQEVYDNEPIQPITIEVSDEEGFLDDSKPKFEVVGNLPQGLEIQDDKIVGTLENVDFEDALTKDIVITIKAVDKLGNEDTKDITIKAKVKTKVLDENLTEEEKAEFNMPSLRVNKQVQTVYHTEEIEPIIIETSYDESAKPDKNFIVEDLPKGLKIEDNKIVGILENVDFGDSLSKQVKFSIKAVDKFNNEVSKEITINLKVKTATLSEALINEDKPEFEIDKNPDGTNPQNPNNDKNNDNLSNQNLGNNNSNSSNNGNSNNNDGTGNELQKDKLDKSQSNSSSNTGTTGTGTTGTTGTGTTGSGTSSSNGSGSASSTITGLGTSSSGNEGTTSNKAIKIENRKKDGANTDIANKNLDSKNQEDINKALNNKSKQYTAIRKVPKTADNASRLYYLIFIFAISNLLLLLRKRSFK